MEAFRGMANNPPRCVFCFIDPEAYELKQCDKKKESFTKTRGKTFVASLDKGRFGGG
jgi:hypothetical protein